MLDRKTYVVKERVAMLKLTDTYDILDPDSGAQIGVAKEEPGNLVKYLRLLVKKQLMPTTVNVYERENEPPAGLAQRIAARARLRGRTPRNTPPRRHARQLEVHARPILRGELWRIDR
jgi:hypothetical protein